MVKIIQIAKGYILGHIKSLYKKVQQSHSKHFWMLCNFFFSVFLKKFDLDPDPGIDPDPELSVKLDSDMDIIFSAPTHWNQVNLVCTFKCSFGTVDSCKEAFVKLKKITASWSVVDSNPDLEPVRSLTYGRIWNYHSGSSSRSQTNQELI